MWQRTPFIGRERELASLAEQLRAASLGEGGVVLITGEPGIGKSRLLYEFAERARGDGWLVLSGRAYDTEGMPPYLPFAEALREYIRATPNEELKAGLGNAGEIALLIPELGERMTLSPAPSLGAEGDRFRLFQSITDLLVQLATSDGAKGLVLSLDDFHWADRSSLLLLQHIARRVLAQPVLIVLGYRTEAISPSAPLFDVLAELSREEVCQRLPLTALSPEESAGLVGQLGGVAAAPEVARAIFDRTEGTPFFVIELTRHLQAEGFDFSGGATALADWGVPEQVRQVIGKRLVRLQPDTRRLLQAASVLGESFNPELARKIAGLEQSEFLDGLDEAIRAEMIHDDPDVHRFSHALVRQTLYEELSQTRRQDMHRRAAEAIEALYALNLEPHISALSLHYRLAGARVDSEQACAYAMKAGDAAMKAYAYVEAVSHYEAALRVLRQRDGADPSRECDLLLAFISAHLSAGTSLASLVEMASAAYSLAESLQDRNRMSAAALAGLNAVGLAWGPSGLVEPEATIWLERADQATPDDTAGRAFIEVSKSQRYAFEGQSDECWESAIIAYRVARRVGVPEELYRAAGYGVLNGAAPAVHRLPEMLSIFREMTTEPRYGVSSGQLARGLRTWGQCYLLDKNRAGFDSVAAELKALASGDRDPWVQGAALHLSMMDLFLRGQLEEALDLAKAAEVQVPYMVPQVAASAAWINLYIGRTSAASAEAAKAISPWAAGARRETIPIPLLAAAGHTDEAASRLQVWLAKNRGASAFLSELTYALAGAIALTDASAAQEIAPHLASVSDLPVSGDFQMLSVGRLLGAAAALGGDYPQARSFTETAIESAERVQFRPEVVLTRLQLAELMLRHYPEERAAALEHLDFVIDDCAAMGMEPARRRAVALRGRRRPSRESQVAAYPDRLSEREVEVLRLIARGHSNKQIAGDLVLSIRTVERHIANLYAKAGVRTKAQATAYAHRNSLV
jgi:DNA-binding CsgD family transcriptional regulator